MSNRKFNDYCGKRGCSVDVEHGHGADGSTRLAYCEHLTVTRGEMDRIGTIWTCTECADQFIPVSVAQKDVDGPEPDAFSIALDAIAGTMSAVLFDYTERMQERYGISPDDVRSDDKPYDCEADGHVRDHDGICQHCGNNPFLGADEL